MNKIYACYFESFASINFYEFHIIKIKLFIIMKALVCISNPPTKQFLWTRHNIGRLFATEHLLKRYQNTSTKQKKYYQYKLNSYPNLIICLSQTYMNLSGQAVTQLLKKHKILKKDLLVVHDDLEHKFGNVRIKEGGSAQGHNGILSIIGAVGGNDFRRLQIGIDRPNSRDPNDVARYVLDNFCKSEKQLLGKAFTKADQILRKEGFF